MARSKPGDSCHGNPQMRWTLFGGYLFKYCSVKYQTFHQVSEKTSQQTYSHQKTTWKAFQMPPRAIKHQLTCPFELTSGRFLIGRRGILVIPRNHLVNTTRSTWWVRRPVEILPNAQITVDSNWTKRDYRIKLVKSSCHIYFPAKDDKAKLLLKISSQSCSIELCTFQMNATVSQRYGYENTFWWRNWICSLLVLRLTLNFYIDNRSPKGPDSI